MALAFSCCSSRLSLALDSRSLSAFPGSAARGRDSVRLPYLSRFPSVRKSNRGVIAMAGPVGRMGMEEPPPDLASHLVKNRIVYLGLPLTPDVSELMFSQILFLQHSDSQRPIYLYINSTGVVKNDERLGYETEALSLYDLMSVIDPPIFTLCVGNAWGDAALLLAAGARGNRAALPSASIMIKEPVCRFQGQAADAEIAKNEIKLMKSRMVELLAKHTGHSTEKIEEDIKQPKYFTPAEALEYGLIDKVLNADKGQESNGVFSQLSGVKLL